MAADMVNHPPHYQNHPVFNGECHDYTRHMFFDQGNAFKYLWRYEGKNGTEDLSKAVWYLNAATHARQLPAVVIDRMESQRLQYEESLDGTGYTVTVADRVRLLTANAMVALAHGDPVAAHKALS